MPVTTPKKPTAKKTPPGKRKRGVRKKRKKTSAWNLSWLLPIFFLALATFTLTLTGYFIFLHTPAPPRTVSAPAPPAEPPARPLPEKKIPPAKPYQAVQAPLEIPSESPSPPTPEAAPPAPPEPEATQKSHKPRLAIIIDDMGFHNKLDKRLLDLDLNLTFSFLPFGPFTTEHATKAAERKHDVLLHLPLEATDPKWNPGKGALFLTMSDQEIAHNLDADLASVPQAIGTNNHMGSRFTENPRAMTVLLKLLKEKNLFFIDSITSSKSVGARLAKSLGLKTARRHFFLDNEQDKGKIIAQLEALVEYAEKHGRGVAIGHPYPETLAALKAFEEELGKRVDLVGIHEMIY